MKVNLKVDGLTIIWLLIITSTVIDCISGFLVQQIGVDLRLSQLSKMMLIAYFFIYILRNDRFLFFLLASFIFMLLLNPIIMIFLYNPVNALMFDIPVALKILLLISATAFFSIIVKKDPIRFLKNAKLTLYLSFFVICINVLLGYLGIGFYSYPSTQFGFKGFFLAGNELGAMFVLLSSFVLFETWKRGKRFNYFFVALFVFFVGASIGTKSATLFGFVAIFIVPFVKMLPTWKTSKILFYSAVLLLIVFSIVAISYSFIAESVLYERLLFILQKHGVVRVFLSGRDIILVNYFYGINDTQGVLPLILGAGSGMSGYANKMIEIDFFDIIIYFGFPVAFLCMALALSIIFISLKLIRKRPYAPLVFIVNSVLLFQSLIAGHVWISGMIGISWALINGLLLINHPKEINRQYYNKALLNENETLKT